MTTITSTMKIDIWSDIACPWCYIGKRRLEDGITRFREAHPEVEVDIEYHSFELAPDTPVDFDGSEIDFLVSHKGMPESQVRDMLDQVTAIARSEGLDYDFDSLRHTNTVKAHELLHHAKTVGVQNEMKERLLRAYFVEGRHVGRVEDLADLASEVGLDRDEVVRVLTEGVYADHVHADQRQGMSLGVQGVPFFVIDRRYGLSGAQPEETFLQALEQALGERGESR